MPRRRSYHHGNLKAALIEAGLELIEEKGIQALTLREIGARSGVSRSAPYRHFTDKAQLLNEIAEAGFKEFADALSAARDAAAPNFAARVSAMGVAYVRFAAEHRAHFEVMFAPLDYPRRSPEGARAFAVLENLIRQGQQSGEVRAGDSAALARFVWSMVHGISLLRLDSEASKHGARPNFTFFCTDLLRAALAPQSAPQPLRFSGGDPKPC